MRVELQEVEAKAAWIRTLALNFLIIAELFGVIMPATAAQTDLIIALSRDKLVIDLPAGGGTSMSGWRNEYPIGNLFLSERVAMSMDKALTQQPDLFGQFSSVEIVVLDRPGLPLPKNLLRQFSLTDLCEKYLSLRAGDILRSDAMSEDILICYTFPSETLQVLSEYYANIKMTHFASIIWQAINSSSSTDSKDSNTYFVVFQNLLMVISSTEGKISFLRSFRVQTQSDLYYFMIACGRMLQSKSHWLITIEDDPAKFEMPGSSFLKIDNQVSLPNIHTLAAQYQQCAS